MGIIYKCVIIIRMRKELRSPTYAYIRLLVYIVRMQMTSQAFRRARSGQPHTSTDAVVATLEPATAAAYRGETQERFSFGMLGIDLNSAEWEKKVMTSWPKKCTFVVREILQTERSYIASLKEIILVSVPHTW